MSCPAPSLNPRLGPTGTVTNVPSGTVVVGIDPSGLSPMVPCPANDWPSPANPVLTVPAPTSSTSRVAVLATLNHVKIPKNMLFLSLTSCLQLKVR